MSYYAVIFTSLRNDSGSAEYEKMAERMVSLAKTQKGYLGIESVRTADGLGITISYWESLADIRTWKSNEEHLAAQERGRSIWYASFRVRICRVEHEYSFTRN